MAKTTRKAAKLAPADESNADPMNGVEDRIKDILKTGIKLVPVSRRGSDGDVWIVEPGVIDAVSKQIADEVRRHIDVRIGK